MPRRKNEEGKTMSVTGVILKTVRLELPIDIHRKLRMQAAKEEKSMAALAREMVEECLKRKNGGK
jgi:plasmid stability protein